MWPFRKTKMFQITWAYHRPSNYCFTEVIRAVDIAAAWRKICGRHGISISLIEWTEVK